MTTKRKDHKKTSSVAQSGKVGKAASLLAQTKKTSARSSKAGAFITPKTSARNTGAARSHTNKARYETLSAQINERIADIQKLRVENDQLSEQLRQATAWLRAA